jgi:hypothetical protein
VKIEGLPTEVKVFDIPYKIEYVEKPSDVDLYKRESLWGQIDFWTRTIRIYKNDTRTVEDVWATIWHELIHAVIQQLNMRSLDLITKEHEETICDFLSMGINSILLDNFKDPVCEVKKNVKRSS